MVFNLPLKKNNDLVFICKKCNHNLFLTEWWEEKRMQKLLKTECPECGEESDENWILSGFDTFKK